MKSLLLVRVRLKEKYNLLTHTHTLFLTRENQTKKKNVRFFGA